MRTVRAVAILAGALSLQMVLPGAAAGDDALVRVAIDGSGSMRGYLASGALEELVAAIDDAAGASGWRTDSYVFHTQKEALDAPHWSQWATWSGDPVWGDVTQLDKAFDVGSRGRSLILVTDNFQDTSGAGAGSSAGVDPLYDRIRDAGAARAWFLPDILAFDGNVDLAPGGGVPGRGSGKASELRAALEASTPARFVEAIGVPRWVAPPGGPGFWKVSFKGRRGLAVYAILFDPSLEAAFDGLVSALSERRSAAALLIRPFAGDSLELHASHDGRPDPRAMACAGLDAGDLPEPNLDLVVAPGAAGPRGRYILRPQPQLTYDPRRPGRFTAAIEVEAADGHVQVQDIAETCAEAASIAVSPMRVVVAPEDQGILLPAATGGGATGRVMPPRLLSPVRANGGGEGRAVFVTFDLPALVGATVPDERVDGRVASEFAIRVEVPGRAVALRPEIREKYFTPTAVDLTRIYSPSDPVQHLATGQIAITIPVEIPAEVFWRPPPPEPVKEPSRLWLVLLVLAALFAFLWWMLKPLGFVAPMRWSEGRMAKAIKVGGLLWRPRDLPELNVGGTRVVHFRREKPWNRRITVLRDEGRVGGLTCGNEVELAPDAGSVKWLPGREAKELQHENRYDPSDH
jgi:hypothetical protein